MTIATINVLPGSVAFATNGRIAGTGWGQWPVDRFS